MDSEAGEAGRGRGRVSSLTFALDSDFHRGATEFCTHAKILQVFVCFKEKFTSQLRQENVASFWRLTKGQTTKTAAGMERMQIHKHK